MSKKIISFLLTVLIVVSCFPLAVCAAEGEGDTFSTETALIYIESTYCTVGKEVEVDVCISENPGIAGAKFCVSFDENLTLIGANEKNGVFEALDYTAPNALGNGCPFNWDSLDAEAKGDGKIITLKFAVADDITPGDQLHIDLSYDYGDIYDVDLNSIAVTTIGGTLDVIDYLPGDANIDGAVNGKDITVIRRYNAEWDVEIDLRAADANGDGEVNGKDVTWIRRYNAEWEGYKPVPTPVACVHTVVAVEAKSPTCTEVGNTAYWQCSACNEYFADNEATSKIDFLDTVITAIGHTEVIDSAAEASCFTTGLTEGKHCSVCNTVIVEQVEVPMIDHTPGVEATCTENQICTVCGEILESANGHVPGVEASCTAPQQCTVCQEALAEAKGHSMLYMEEKDPVNENDHGNCAYWQCSVCNKCYLDEEATQEIALADTVWKTYLVYFFDLENDTYTIGIYKQSEVLSLKNIVPVEIKGYDFNGWHTSENFSEENKISLIPANNTEKIDLYANRSLHEYKITVLGLGREESYSYNILNGIKFAIPKWQESAGSGDCLIFSHWTDENGNKIEEIRPGEAEDRTITANWIYKENYAVSNKNKYTYVNGVIDQYGRYSFIYEIGAINNIVLSKQHVYAFDALTEHTVTESKTYTVGTAAGREAAKTVSRIISSSIEMANIEKHTTTHTEGWNVGAKWKPEIEIEGIKVSAWEFSGGYSNSDADVYENTGFNSESYYEENGAGDEIRSTIDYYMEESASRTVSDTFVPGVSPVGTYTWARLMDVKVYAIVTYNPYTGNYVFDTYSVPTHIHNGLLYTLPTDIEYEINIVSGDVLDFEIPFEDIPEMFYTVEYDANGGVGEMPKDVHELGVTSNLFGNMFKREGYTFAGWKTTPDGDFHVYGDKAVVGDIAAFGETVTLYAHWIPNEYKVTFDAYGGSVTPATKTVIYGASYGELPKPVRTGYEFDGWMLGESIVTSDTKVSFIGAHTLVAKWNPITYYVTYNANGGVGTMASSGHNYGERSSLSQNGFSREGYAFIGWSVDKSAVFAEYEQSILYTHANNITLYAVWAKVNATIVFNASNGHRDETVTDNDAVWDSVKPGFNREQLIRAGYTNLTITVVFDGKKDAMSEYWELWVHASTGKIAYDRWHYSGSGWETHDLGPVTVSLINFDEYCNFELQWGASGDLEDDWYLGETYVYVTATK